MAHLVPYYGEKEPTRIFLTQYQATIDTAALPFPITPSCTSLVEAALSPRLQFPASPHLHTNAEAVVSNLNVLDEKKKIDYGRMEVHEV